MQILYRIQKRITRKYAHRQVLNQKTTFKVNFFGQILYKKAVFDTQDLLNDTFKFLNVTYTFKENIQWYSTGQTTLWEFHLNYFDYLYTIKEFHRMSQEDNLLKKALSWIEHWIDQSERFNDVMWSPYTISLRVVNWLDFILYLQSIGYAFKTDKIMASIQAQSLFLKRHLEWDVKGNHLIENFKTLILITLIKRDVEGTRQYLNLLLKNLNNQILADGCHYEKSISYHVVLLEGMLNVLEWLLISGSKDKLEWQISRLWIYVQRMYRFYIEIRYGQDIYPLFNDSNLSMTNSIKDLDLRFESILEQLRSNEISDREDIKSSGYQTVESSKMKVVMDGGTLGPNALLAHAHNDIAHFELHLKGYPTVLTDTGVSEYQPGQWRNYARSTKAHNTVLVGGLEQADMFQSFRVGWRPQNVQSEKKIHEDTAVLSCFYKGKGYRHKREISIDFSEQNIIIRDFVKTIKQYPVQSYLHFGPEYDVILNGQDAQVCLNNQLVLAIKCVNAHTVSLYFGNNHSTLGWFLPQFGQTIKRTTLEMVSDSTTEFTGFNISIFPLNAEG